MVKKFKKETITTEERIVEEQKQPAGQAQKGQPEIGGQPATPQEQPVQPGEAPQAPEAAQQGPQSQQQQPQQPKAEEPGQQGQPGQPGQKPSEPGQKPSEKEISPNLKEGELSKPVDLSKQGAKDQAKDKAKDAVKDKGEKAAKKPAKELAKQLAKKAAQAVARYAAAAASAVVAAVGWPIVIGCIVVFILVVAIFGGLMCVAMKGYFGKTYPIPAGKDNTNVQAMLASNKQASQDGFHKLDFLSNRDKEFVESGKLDTRLAAAIKYLVERHNRIGISYIISTYENMPTDPESGADRDPQLTKNVSAHKDGLAADVAEIDFVYKVYEPNPACTDGMVDLVYYADQITVPPSNKANVPNIPNIPQVNVSDINLSQSLDELNKALDNLKASIDSSTNGEVKDLGENIDPLKTKIGDLKGKTSSQQEIIKNLLDQLNALSTEVQKQQNQDSADLNKRIEEMKSTLQKMLNNLQQVNYMVSDINVKIDNFQQSLASGQADLSKETQELKNSLSALDGLQNTAFMKNLDNINNSLSQVSGQINTVIDGFQKQLSNLGDLTNQLKIDFGNIPGLPGLGFGNNELLRLICEGVSANAAADANMTLNGNPTKAIPIKVSWQDAKPDIPHVSSQPDDSTSTDPRVFYIVYQPQAREKTHQVIGQLLQFPYDLNDVEYYKVTQLITFSYERDVGPFAETLDKLYGKVRPANYGLFAMPESWAHVHIGY